MSIEHVRPLLQKPLLSIELTPAARTRVHQDILGHSRARRRVSDYTIEIGGAELPAEEVADMVQAFA